VSCLWRALLLVRYNYIGPRRRYTRGELVLRFTPITIAEGRADGDVVRCGDRVFLDVVTSNRTQVRFNNRLSNSKRAASSLLGGYLCSCGEGRVRAPHLGTAPGCL
jgi:hypothetical protein